MRCPYCQHHDEQVVLCAVNMALQAGVPTKTHVLNLLHRLVDALPRAEGAALQAGHVPHQSNAKEFNGKVMNFLNGLG